MASTHDPSNQPALASPHQVRVAAVYAVLVGGLLVFLGYRGWSLRGLLPAYWLGWPLVAIALFMFARPDIQAFRERVGRVVGLFSP